MKTKIIFMILTIYFSNLITCINIKMCINNNNNNNLPNRLLEIGDNNNLILLNSQITSEWCKNWLYEMSLYKKNDNIDYPQYMISDIMSMRIYCETNKKDNFFYIGYVPKNINTINGPLYIGAFKLIEDKRIYNFEKIIQNPSNSRSDISTSVIDFRNDLYDFVKETNYIMNIGALKNFSNNRYWLDFTLF